MEEGKEGLLRGTDALLLIVDRSRQLHVQLIPKHEKAMKESQLTRAECAMGQNGARIWSLATG